MGHGDADPSNVSFMVRGAELRIAETRAVNRALRKAYGIGLCSVEELGAFSSPPRSTRVLCRSLMGRLPPTVPAALTGRVTGSPGSAISSAF